MKIGTRGSALALWQAHHVKARLEAAEPGLGVELVLIKTKGDKILDVPLAKVGGKGLFVKEIEEALARGEIDLAVHSMKDVPAELHPGLCLAGVSSREDPADALVSRAGGLDALPRGARVGTSSLRRICQLRARRPDLTIGALRGNVDTRLRKLDAGEYDAIVLAAAGLIRLGHGDRISERLGFAVSLPATGQGALGLESREDDAVTRGRVERALHDPGAAACVGAERAFLRRIGGGCQTPLAAHARLEGDRPGGATLELEALVGEPDGSHLLRERRGGPAGEGEALGVATAEALLARGADEILARCEAEGIEGGA